MLKRVTRKTQTGNNDVIIELAYNTSRDRWKQCLPQTTERYLSPKDVQCVLL